MLKILGKGHNAPTWILYLASSWMIVLLFVYFAPTVGPEVRAIFGESMAEGPLRLLVILALAQGIFRIESPAERRFWALVLAAFLSWFVADLTFNTTGDTPLVWYLLQDASFLLFYPLLIVAVEQRPDRFNDPIASGGARWLGAACGVGFVLWLYVYFVLSTANILPDIFLKGSPSFAYYCSSDIVLGCILMFRAMFANGRWGMLYLLMGLAMFGFALGDYMSLQTSLTGVGVPYGTAQDFFWYAPYFIVIACALYRDYSYEANGPITLQGDYPHRSLVVTAYGYVVAVPTIHMTARQWGWLPQLSMEREIVVVCGVLFLLAIAILVHHKSRIKRDTSLQVWVFDEELQQKQRMESLGRLAGGIAHDFNNILLILRGNLEMIGQRDTSGAVREWIRQMDMAVNQGSRLTRQLLAFGREQVVQPQWVNPNQIIDETRSLLSRTLGAHVTLQVEKDPDLWPVRMDPGQLTQVLINLALNASHAMANGGALRIRTQNVSLDLADQGGTGDFVEIELSDDGLGMEERVRSRIFEPFFSTRHGLGGTGLGLSVVYGIVKQSGGYITCRSQPGQGTTFLMHLPRPIGQDYMSPDPVPESTIANGEESILVVEDDSGVRTVTCQFLEGMGYRVVSAEDGIEALEILQRPETEIDLVVTDVVMPNMGGIALAKHIEALMPSMPVLFVSGYPKDVEIDVGQDLNNCFLQKPYSMKTLQSKIRQLLETNQRRSRVSRESRV